MLGKMQWEKYILEKLISEKLVEFTSYTLKLSAFPGSNLC